ncbi:MULTISPECIES: YchJ family protein [Streptomyces]|uniref:UPF0225 protein HG542_08275 n=1 Tax=Streptomyces morookaense TaxID=1970 RepID=A0A7Y7B299_STRMO|nr:MULTISPECIES: YchJ family protein [Streptomyces]MCC2275934.1 YchJ family protein [Streptomyces sp. ET3-23]NVK77662.1 YchJ family protein [Streptomyces morookaense]
MSRSSARPRPAVGPTSPCPCGLGDTYQNCCGVFHSGQKTAPTAERLMRSRYAAFVVRDTAYLLRSWHSSTRPGHLDLDPEMRWTGLDVLATTDGSPFHQEGTVEFRAHYSERGHQDVLHEVSRFVREDGQWVYLDGAVT